MADEEKPEQKCRSDCNCKKVIFFVGGTIIISIIVSTFIVLNKHDEPIKLKAPIIDKDNIVEATVDTSLFEEEQTVLETNTTTNIQPEIIILVDPRIKECEDLGKSIGYKDGLLGIYNYKLYIPNNCNDIENTLVNSFLDGYRVGNELGYADKYNQDISYEDPINTNDENQSIDTNSTTTGKYYDPQIPDEILDLVQNGDLPSQVGELKVTFTRGYKN